MEAVLDWVVRLVLAVGGVSGIGALILVGTQKKKLVAEAGKTVAEADSIMSESGLKRTDREAKILDMSERLLEQLEEQNREANRKVDRLTEYVETLVFALRAAGAPVPPMPRQMADDAHRANRAREQTSPPTPSGGIPASRRA